MEAKWPTLPQLKHLKGSLPLNLLVHHFNFITKLASYSSSESSLQLEHEQDFDFWLFFFVFLEALNVAFFLDGFSCSIIISYVLKIPCNSSMLSLSRSFLYSRPTLESNLIGRDLSIFWTSVGFSTFSPRPLMVFTISSTRRK